MDGAAFDSNMAMIARDPALLRAYEAYDRAESDWVTSMDTAERRGWQKRQPEVDTLKNNAVSLKNSNDALLAEIAELRRRLGGQ